MVVFENESSRKKPPVEDPFCDLYRKHRISRDSCILGLPTQDKTTNTPQRLHILGTIKPQRMQYCLSLTKTIVKLYLTV